MKIETLSLNKVAKTLNISYWTARRGVRLGYIKAVQDVETQKWRVPVSWFANLKAYICDTYSVNIRNKKRIRKHLEDLTARGKR